MVYLLGDANVLTISLCLFVMNLGIASILPNMVAKIFGIFEDAIGLVGAFYGAFRMLIPGLVGLFISMRHIADVKQMCITLLVINVISIVTYILSESKTYGKFHHPKAIPVSR